MNYLFFKFWCDNPTRNHQLSWTEILNSVLNWVGAHFNIVSIFPFVLRERIGVLHLNWRGFGSQKIGNQTLI